MRTSIFRCLYWITSVVVALLALPLLLLPGRKPLMIWLRIYARTMVFWMRAICGISIEVRGLENVPAGACIIAAKHQSWGDGYAAFAQIPDLAIVTGDHLERIPLVGFILRKMEAVVVDNCGGASARARLVDEDISRTTTSDRKMLIYPEGHLAPVGYHYRYKKGVFHMYRAHDCPVVPVATNLGLLWPLDDWDLRPGTAVLEFLEPLEPGMEKAKFMAELEARIEAASLALLPDGFAIPDPRELEYDKENDRGVLVHPDGSTEAVS